MTEQLANFIAVHGREIEAALHRWLPLSGRAGAEPLNDALHYALFPGGKRLRPVLTLIGTKLAGGNISEAIPAACAIEFLHTSSLILDDLPAMDDADLRRGRATVHQVYGESMALLAALALFNQSYALLARAGCQRGSLAWLEQLMTEATHCLGANGVIGGQAVDLATMSVEPEDMASRNLKTTALMRLTMTAGAIACGASEADVMALARFGECLGLVYQICDDLLDELGDSTLMGKPAWQDARHLRPTFVAELGVAGAQQFAMALAEEGKTTILQRFGPRAETQLLMEAMERVIRDVAKLELVAEPVV